MPPCYPLETVFPGPKPPVAPYDHHTPDSSQVGICRLPGIQSIEYGIQLTHSFKIQAPLSQLGCPQEVVQGMSPLAATTAGALPTYSTGPSRPRW